jgi:outer membrane protein, heavy metal efflux system
MPDGSTVFSKYRLSIVSRFSALAAFAWLLTSAAPGVVAAGDAMLVSSQKNATPGVQAPAALATRPAGAAVASLKRSLPSTPVGTTDLEHNPSLEIVQRYAAEHNPAIRAAFFAWQAARERITQARSYQNPLVTYQPDTYNMAIVRQGAETSGGGFSQSIPFPGKLTLSGDIANQQAQAARENLAAVTQETYRKVWSVYADFYFADRALEVNAESTTLARQFEAIAEAKYKVGTIPEQDVIQAQEKISRFATQQVGFIQQRNAAMGALNTLLDRAPRAILGHPIEMATAELKIPLQELLEEASAARPEIRAEDHLVRARERSVTLAKMGFLPDFSIGGQYMGIDGRMGDPGFTKDGHDIWAAAIGFSIPIWLDRVKAHLDETRAQLQQERFTRRDVEDTVNDQIQDAYERLMAAACNERIYRTTLLPQTAERIRAAQAGYQTGTVDFLTLIDSLKSYEDVRLLDYQSIRAYQTAAADLTRAVGELIRGIAK